MKGSTALRTVAFHTLGCKVNQYDTEAIWQLFQANGYTQVDFEAQADVYVINTCTVTHEGDRKSRQMIRRATRNNPESVVVVTGCYAQMAPGEVLSIAGVDLVVGNQYRAQMVDMVEKVRLERMPYNAVSNILTQKEFEDLDVPVFMDRTRASLKIEDGCNHFCTFCIIPYARGLVRSRKPESVLFQARRLADAGYQEIVLTGIHTGGYGEDLEGYTLADLLCDMENIDNLLRIRISSIEASEISDDLLLALSRSKKVCRHLHIPLQAGHSEVLRRMNRHYTIEEYAKTLQKVRQALPEVAITSDIIVGFPGETDEFFETTVQFVRAQQFADLHVFPYSIRKGTPAAKFTDQIPEDVKHQRVSRMIALADELSLAYAKKWVARPLAVIAEEVIDIDHVQHVAGHADNYLKVAFPDDETLLGQVCTIQIMHPDKELCLGAMQKTAYAM